MNFFIPTERNHYRAKVLQPSFLFFSVFAFLLFQSVLGFIAVARPGVLGYSSEITPEKIVNLTNLKRQEAGLAPLKLNPVLSEAATRKAGDMFAFNYWAHTSPSGRTPWTFFKEAGYQYLVAGENLAKDFYSSDGAVDAWMKSPAHRANLMNSRFEEIGVAVVNGTLEGVQTTLVVQLFGTPTPGMAPESEVAKASVPATGTREAIAGGEAITTPILSKTSDQYRVLADFIVNPLKTTKAFSAFLMGIVIGVLALDGYLVLRHKIYRVSGRNTAHISFLAILFLMILFSQAGIIK